MKNYPLISTLLIAVFLTSAPAAHAQIAGYTNATGITVTEATELALGWSVKKSIMGKNVYNDAGEKVGKVEDLIVAPEKNLSYLIIGAGGFVGIGRHDVAIPVSQVQNLDGKLVMPGATKAVLKAMPVFNYASDNARREQFIASTENEIAVAKTALADMKKKAGTVASEGKAQLEAQTTALETDVKAADAKLTTMKEAASVRWKDFEAGVQAAVARMHKSLQSAKA